MIARIASWIRRGLGGGEDPQREAWESWCSGELVRLIGERKKAFSLASAIQELDVEARYVPGSTRRAFRFFLRRAWHDLTITADELQTLHWLGGALEIPPDEAEAIRSSFGFEVFARAIRRATADGILEHDELVLLERLATANAMPLPELASKYLEDQSDRIVADLASIALDDLGLTDERWKRAIAVYEKLGVTGDAFHSRTRAAALRFVQDFAERAAEDSEVTNEEQKRIAEITSRFRLGDEARELVRGALKGATRVVTEEHHDVAELARRLNQCGKELALRPTPDPSESLPAEFRNAIGNSAWWEITSARDASAKYSAGASRSVERNRTWTGDSKPRHLKTRNLLPTVRGHFGSAYFLPSGLLILRKQQFVGLPYQQVSLDQTHFVESDTPPRNAKVIGHTWQYVNKNGGPDRRFQSNRQYPVCQYSVVHLPMIEVELQSSEPDLAGLLAVTRRR